MQRRPFYRLFQHQQKKFRNLLNDISVFGFKTVYSSTDDPPLFLLYPRMLCWLWMSACRHANLPPSPLHLSPPPSSTSLFPLITLFLYHPHHQQSAISVSPSPANQIAWPPCSPQEPAVTWRREPVNKRHTSCCISLPLTHIHTNMI